MNFFSDACSTGMAKNLVAWIQDEHVGQSSPQTQRRKSGKKYPEMHS
jgi:hypothetical protein